VEGRNLSGDPPHSIKCFDAFTGATLWTVPSTRNNGSAGMVVDPTGRFVAFQADNSHTAALMDLASGMRIKTLPWFPVGIGPATNFYAANLPSYHDRGCSLFGGSPEIPFVTLGIDAANPFFVQPGGDGTRLIWGNTDGTITVCNLREIHDRLRSVGLQW
jgi:hypothetical protein